MSGERAKQIMAIRVNILCFMKIVILNYELKFLQSYEIEHFIA
jgi:hypothetical protein